MIYVERFVTFLPEQKICISKKTIVILTHNVLNIFMFCLYLMTKSRQTDGRTDLGPTENGPTVIHMFFNKYGGRISIYIYIYIFKIMTLV